MSCRLAIAVLGVSASACGSPDPARPSWAPESEPAVVIQFNVAGGMALAGEAVSAGNIAALISDRGADFVGLQECDPCDALLEELPVRYRLAAAPRSGIAILYDADRWQLQQDDSILLGDNDDSWGARHLVRARFLDSGGQRPIDVYSTHWCVTVRTDSDRCDAGRHVEYAEMLVNYLEPDFPAIVAGDFNVFDGFEEAPAIRYMVDNAVVPLTDVFRAVNQDPGATFFGNSFAPPGRIDYLFANLPTTVLQGELVVATEPGSDHAAVVAALQF